MSRLLRDIPNWNVKSSEKDNPRTRDKQEARKEIRENLPDDLTRAPRVL